MNRNDLNTFEPSVRSYICSLTLYAPMEKLKKKSKVMLAIEIAIYLAIAVSVALLIIL